MVHSTIRVELNGHVTMNHLPLLSNVSIWIGIAFCISQSAIFSGLNLAIFSISKLRLEVEAAGGNRDAGEVLALRKDSNLTLATVLWGNVTINVLLTLLIIREPANLTTPSLSPRPNSGRGPGRVKLEAPCHPRPSTETCRPAPRRKRQRGRTGGGKKGGLVARAVLTPQPF